jgi:hypothetical protein
MEDGTMKEKEIDGIRFSVAPFRAVEALKLKSFLLRKFGPSIGQAFGVLKDGLPENGGIGDMKLDGSALSQAIEKLMEQLGEAEFIDLIKRMFGNVTANLVIDGKPLQFSFSEIQFDTSMDMVFSGRLFTIYPVILLVLEANFPDFFGKLAQGIGSRIKKMVTSGPAEEGSKAESGKLET